MTNAIANRLRLDDIRSAPQSQLSALPAEQLALLQEDAHAALEASRSLKEWIDGAIAARYGERAQALRLAQGKDTGAVRFEDGAVTVACELPKKVEWDQARLGRIVERIVASGEAPDQYVDITFKVAERKYTAWPDAIRASFEPARVVRTGKPTFRLSINQEII